MARKIATKPGYGSARSRVWGAGGVGMSGGSWDYVSLDVKEVSNILVRLADDLYEAQAEARVYRREAEQHFVDLREAAEAVRLLLDVLRKAGPPPCQAPWDRIEGKPEHRAVLAYRALPAWMRREIER